MGIIRCHDEQVEVRVFDRRLQRSQPGVEETTQDSGQDETLRDEVPQQATEAIASILPAGCSPFEIVLRSNEKLLDVLSIPACRA